MSSRDLALYLRLWKTVFDPKDRAGGEGYVVCWSRVDNKHANPNPKARGNTHSLTAYTQVNPVVRFGTAPKSCGLLPSGRHLERSMWSLRPKPGFRSQNLLQHQGVGRWHREACVKLFISKTDMSMRKSGDAFLRTLRVVGSWLQAFRRWWWRWWRVPRDSSCAFPSFVVPPWSGGSE